MNTLSVGQKQGGALAILVGLIIFLSVFSYNRLAVVFSVSNSISQILLPSVRLAGDMQIALLNARRAELADNLESKNSSVIENQPRSMTIKKAKNDFETARMQYEQLSFLTDYEKKTFKSLADSAKSYFSAARTSIDSKSGNDNTPKVRKLLSDAITYASELQAINENIATEMVVDLSEKYESSRIAIITSSFLAVLFSIAIAIYLINQIRRPISILLNQTSLIAQGDLVKELSMAKFNNDEFGALARGFNDMQNQIRRLVSEVSNSITQLSTATEEISTVASQSACNMNNQQNELNQLVSVMSNMQSIAQDVVKNTDAAANEAVQASSKAEIEAGTVRNAINSIEKVAVEIETSTEVIEQLREDSRNMVVYSSW